ncbi:glycosyltransferase family 2 protein [Sphingobacterium sp. HJSM2_6]|uniref:glycosyltransferase family 2 protein n=1 Tax=Sphingobacterium sp. HJSM2_6 TaxID=3366264 RepID=UPI003BE461A4
MNVPIFSIIIPLYNAKGFIEKTLESILTQNFKEFEVIIINDGSTDGGEEICEDLCNKDFRLKLINQKNHGVSYSRNRAIKESKGEYIIFVDADDFIEENFLNHLSVDQENHPDSFIIQDFCKIGLDAVKKDVYKLIDQELSISDFILQFDLTKFGHIASKIYSRSILINNNIKFPEHIKLSEDSIFFIDYLNFVDKIYLSSKKGYYYREVENSAITKKISMNEIFDLYNLLNTSLNRLVKMKNVAVNEKEKLKFWIKAVIDNVYSLNLDENQRIDYLRFIRERYYNDVIFLYSKSKFRGRILKLSFQLGLLHFFDKMFQKFER